MKSRYVAAAIALTAVGWCVTAYRGPTVALPEVRIVEPAPTLAANRAALSGVWEGMGPETLPTRLVVEEVHDQWASILLAWGDHPDGKYARGSLRGKAKVLPDGTLHWRHLGEIAFRLSDDWNNLVARQNQGGRVGVVVLRRVPPESALSALSAPRNAK